MSSLAHKSPVVQAVPPTAAIQPRDTGAVTTARQRCHMAKSKLGQAVRAKVSFNDGEVRRGMTGQVVRVELPVIYCLRVGARRPTLS
jgi:hypothetical protein